MSKSVRRNWQEVMSELEQRIYSRQWQPGDLIPTEADLAVEFGCARVTMNRALRTLAETGLLDRRRKAGTRVTVNPISKATLQIPVIRSEIEALDYSYGYHLLHQQIEIAPSNITDVFDTPSYTQLLHVISLHSADGEPYVIEDRWINLVALPHLTDVSFAALSANEWLLHNTPFTHGDISFGAANASTDEANILKIKAGAALFMIERTTRDRNTSIEYPNSNDIALTNVRLLYRPGYQAHAEL
jgi:GntR family histidine utilization transcriptional repressor